jgi:hypothetical protein
LHSVSGGSGQTGQSPFVRLAEFSSMVRAHFPCSFIACRHLFRAQIEKEIAAVEMFHYTKRAATSGFFRVLFRTKKSSK